MKSELQSFKPGNGLMLLKIRFDDKVRWKCYSWRPVQSPHSLLSLSTATVLVGTWKRHHQQFCHHHHHRQRHCRPCQCHPPPPPHHHHQDGHPKAWKNKWSRKEGREGRTSNGRDEVRLNQCFGLVRQICTISFYHLMRTLTHLMGAH